MKADLYGRFSLCPECALYVQSLSKRAVVMVVNYCHLQMRNLQCGKIKSHAQGRSVSRPGHSHLLRGSSKYTNFD